MALFATLLISHLIADFPLQAGWIYAWKMRSPLGLTLHAALHAIVPLALFRAPLMWWPAFYALALVHYQIDWAKINHPIRPQTRGFVLDQLSHAVSLIPFIFLIPQAEPVIPARVLALDLILLMLPPLLLLGWTATWDMQEPRPDSRPHTIFTWVRRNALRISQIFGMATVLLVAFQIWLN